MQETKYRFVLLFGGAVLLAFVAGSLYVAQPIGEACQVHPFSRPPLYTSTGFWNSSHLVVLDTIRRDLLRFGKDGRAERSISELLPRGLSDLDPISVVRRSDGLTGDNRIIILGEFNRFQILNSEYNFEGSVDVFSLPMAEGSSIERIYTWAPTWSPGRKDVVAFADLKKDNQWSPGIVRFPVDGRTDASARFLINLSPTAVSRKFHRLGYPYIASLEEDAYIMLMEDGFRLWKSDRTGGFTELPRFHETFPTKETPVLPSYIRSEDFSSVMNEVETAKMPTGLLSWKGKLYVVWRRPHAARGTEWLLSKVRLNDGEILATVTIPSRANHMFAVPGESTWGFIEKGPAFGLRDQEVRNMVTVSSERLRIAFGAAERRDTASLLLSLCP